MRLKFKGLVFSYFLRVIVNVDVSQCHGKHVEGPLAECSVVVPASQTPSVTTQWLLLFLVLNPFLK